MTSLNQRIKILEVYSGIETSVISISDVSELQTELDTKQDTLTAGGNITIVDNVISSSGSGGSGASNISEITGLQDELDSKQNVLTAGDNITIVDNVISSSGSGASLISDVSGLQAELDSKQNVLTSGDNITIVDNVISSTGSSSSSSIELFKFSMVRSNTAVSLDNDEILGFVNLDRETSGLTMTSNDGIITFGGSNVAGTYEIKYSLVLTNFQGTTNRMYIRAYKNGLWIAEFGKLSGFLENGSFIVDIADGDTIQFKITGLQTGSLSLATGLVSETYDSCVLIGIKLF